MVESVRGRRPFGARSVRAVVLSILLASPWGVLALRGDQARSPAGRDAASANPVTLAPAIDDVEAAFSRIEARGRQVAAPVNGLIPDPWYQAGPRNWFGFRNHFQGIRRVPGTRYLVLSGSNVHEPMGSLFIVRMDAESATVVGTVAVDDVLWHAGGLGIDGHVLGVPLYGDSPLRGKVTFYDMRDPERPSKLPVEIDRPGEKAYAVALTRMQNGHYLAGVLADRDGIPRRIDFYLSRSRDFADGFDPEPIRWFASEVDARNDEDRNFGDFQGLSFVRQTDGRLFLVGFHNTVPSMPFIPGRDYADLYEVVVPDDMRALTPAAPARPCLEKVASAQLFCKDGYCNLDAAAGLYVDPASRELHVYAASGWLDDGHIKYTVYRQR